MSSELNLQYFTFLNGQIVCAEGMVALVGAILNSQSYIVRASSFLAFVLWTTIIFSGVIIVLNVLNLYKKLIDKFGVIVGQCELVYAGLWLIFYLICAIFSFIPGSNEKNRLGWKWSNESGKIVQVYNSYWSATHSLVHVCGYIEILLFLVDGYLQYKIPRIVTNSTTSEKEMQENEREQEGKSSSTLKKEIA